jgi:uncharacterized protein YndB with AHSA1/START domain
MDPKLDLVLERVVDVPRELVWKAWTEPKHLEKWFTPAPWRTTDVEIELRPGGAFKTVMRGPNGEVMPSEGCYLEVVPKERLTWTSALLGGFRPAKLDLNAGCAELSFTATITFKSKGKKTLYRAVAMHPDPESAKKHADMGFQDGWGKALEQLVAHCKTMK